MITNWRKYSLMSLVMILIGMTACEIEPITDPNNPSLGSVTMDASKAELQTLVYGLEARHRGYYTNATQMFGSFAREVYAFFGSDPRFKDDWLGLVRTETYPDFFASAGTYVNPYLAVKQANVLIEAANNSTQLTREEALAYTGLAKTVKGFQLLWPLWQQNPDVGIRVEVEDPLNPGPTLPFDQALAAIREILNDGNSDLGAATGLPFDLTSGFAGFASPNGLQQINRAAAARAALYAEDWSGALTALDASYLNLNATTVGDLYVGPEHVYGEAPDINNPLFYPLDAATSTILVVHPSLLEDALPGDRRVDFKFAERVNNPVTDASVVDQNGDLIVGRYQDARWQSNTSPIGYLRNEELILIYAEAKARLGEADDAVDAINTIRNIWGLDDYDGDTDTESLIDEILFQRRYSLWAEAGMRWIDLRRTGRLNGDYVDLRDGGNLFPFVARRVSEISWDEG